MGREGPDRRAGLQDHLGLRAVQGPDEAGDRDGLPRLEEAGAVLVAKLAVGELAWGDVWFGGTTKNPWKLDQGSSGSSAGSASATAAGLVGFALGTETLGSIVSPCTRCGVTGLRPTFGRVSRHGAMALAWTMDKVGPIARSAEDCALVFSAIEGRDALDPYSADGPPAWPPRRSLANLTIGFVESSSRRSAGRTRRRRRRRRARPSGGRSTCGASTSSGSSEPGSFR